MVDCVNAVTMLRRQKHVEWTGLVRCELMIDRVTEILDRQDEGSGNLDRGPKRTVGLWKLKHIS